MLKSSKVSSNSSNTNASFGKTTSPHSYYRNSLNGTLSGPGVKDGSIDQNDWNNDPIDTLIGLSENIHKLQESAIHTWYQDNGYQPLIDALPTALLPQDWRAFAHYDCLIFDADDWNALTPNRHKAVLEAVASGLQLRITGNPTAIAALSAAFNATEPPPEISYGLGHILLFEQTVAEALQVSLPKNPLELHLFNLNYNKNKLVIFAYNYRHKAFQNSFDYQQLADSVER